MSQAKRIKRSYSPAQHQKPQASHPFQDAVVPPELKFSDKKGNPLHAIRNHSTKFFHRDKRPRFFLIPTSNQAQFQPKFTQSNAFNNKMLNYAQLITTPTADTRGTCLLLHYDNKRYIFGNLAEGTQRAMVQRGIGINKADNFFLSGLVNWQNMGGLLGMVLTLADVVAGQKEHEKEEAKARKEKGLAERKGDAISGVNFHGGKNLAYFLATARRFIFRKGLPLRPHEIRVDPSAMKKDSSEPDWQDTNMKVWYMLVESAELPSSEPRKRSYGNMEDADANANDDEERQLIESVVANMFDSDWKMDALVETTLHQAHLPAKLFVRDEAGHIKVYEGPLPGEAEDVPDVPVLVREPWPATKVRDLPPTTPARQSMCYIVKNHDRRGKFNPQEAMRLGVPKGKSFAKLTKCESVTTLDGKIVTPEMVLGETAQGRGFAVLDIPDSSYIEPLITRSEWSNDEIMKNISVMYWILGPDLLGQPRLQEFIKKHETVRHIVCSGDVNPNMLAFESVAAQNYKLHSIDSERFPLPIYSNEKSVSGKSTFDVPDTCEVGRTGKMIQFSPRYIHQDDQIIPFPDVRKLGETDETVPWLFQKAEELAEEAKSKLNDSKFLDKIEQVEADIPNRDAEIITLGTGSALPSKYRNVSANLVMVPGFGNYLFDAGENTLGQLRRVFGRELPTVLRDLKVIWISHLHADHHLGTAAIIKAWHDETRKTKPEGKLHVASHEHMLNWLREYSGVEDFGYDRCTTTNFFRWEKSGICIPAKFRPEETEVHGLSQIDACLVSHCHGAMATVFTWPSGLKVAYSGDCRPSDSFVEIGQGATLLIHESTFDDQLQGDAIAKKHSTMSEAIDVGRRMGARRIMLTHFSQRYQKVPTMEGDFNVDPDAEGKEKAIADQVILVGFDYMRVKLGDFRKAQAFLPALQKLFEDVGAQ